MCICCRVCCRFANIVLDIYLLYVVYCVSCFVSCVAVSVLLSTHYLQGDTEALLQ